MNVHAVSALLAALVILAIGMSVLLRNRSDRTYTVLGWQRPRRAPYQVPRDAA